MKQRKMPLRKCTGCGEMKEKRELIRVVKAPDTKDENGEIIDDVIVMHMADGLYWVSDLYGPRLLPWIEKHKGTADIQTRHAALNAR